MSKTSYKAWLQNNGFVQSIEDKNTFELKENADTLMLVRAKEKAKELGIKMELDCNDLAPTVVIKGSMPTIVNTSRSEDVISVSWHVDDVLYNAKDKGIKGLTKEDARNVLAYVKRKHDASIGVNWDVLTEWSQHVLDEKKAAKKSK